MTPSIKTTIILILTLLASFPCFASENRLSVFNTDYFTINLPVQMRQVGRNEIPFLNDKKGISYVFVESDKAREKSIMLIISLEKNDHPVNNDSKDKALNELAKTLHDTAGEDFEECRGFTTGIVVTRISGQKAYYFERRNKNCVVTLERHWATINGNNSCLIYLARPGKLDNAVARSVINGIVKIKLK
ncbi:MAG: hypothetical protein VB050_12755 [Geobacteraceae bacterium]|nr:hypothetical protein [Geobacteraceae bacterium]